MAEETAVTPFFTDPERELLSAVLDRIVPAAKELPGAGQLGVVEYVDGAVSESSETKVLFSRGLAAIRAGAADFAGLVDELKDDLLRRVESAEPEFFQTLVRLTYNGYYTSPRVQELLGLGAGRPSLSATCWSGEAWS